MGGGGAEYIWLYNTLDVILVDHIVKGQVS